MKLVERIKQALEADPTLTAKRCAEQLGAPLGSVTKCASDASLRFAPAYKRGRPQPFKKIRYAGYEAGA